jgi:hypothetical protein
VIGTPNIIKNRIFILQGRLTRTPQLASNGGMTFLDFAPLMLLVFLPRPGRDQTYEMSISSIRV